MPHDCAEEGHQMVPHGGGSICNYCLTVVPPPVQGFVPAEDVKNIVKQVAREFKRRAHRIVTSWTTGVQVSIDVTDVDFESFIKDVGESFGFENPRVYALQNSDLSLKDKIKLDEAQYGQCIARTGNFTGITKLYVCDNDSPTTSPGGKTFPDEAASQHSNNSNRSGQAEFRESILRRDKNTCVFCNSTTPPIEAAHVLPVEQKSVLFDEEKCMLYGIYSIMDSSNGIALCWACHKCFDANLVCIDPSTGALLVTEALLANEPEKWTDLKNKIVPTCPHCWPNKELLKFREQAMLAATTKRNEAQLEYQLFCRYCTQGYKRPDALQKHEQGCEGKPRGPSSFKTPRKNPDAES